MSKDRNSPEQLTEHHRKPKSIGGNNSTANISVVRRKHHQAFHTLFGNSTPQEIVAVLNETWIDPEWQIKAVLKNR